MCVCVCVWVMCLWITCPWINWCVCYLVYESIDVCVYIYICHHYHSLCHHVTVCYTSLTPRRVHCLAVPPSCVSNFLYGYITLLCLWGICWGVYVCVCTNNLSLNHITLLCLRGKSWCICVYVCLYMYVSESLLFY